MQNTSVSTMLQSKLCLVPTGDTVASRRLFNAMSAGCVPVVVTPKGLSGYLKELPFPQIIEWDRNIYHWQTIAFDEEVFRQGIKSEAYRTAVVAGAQGLRTLISDLNGKGELRLMKRRQRVEKCYAKSLATDRHADGVIAAMLEIMVLKMKTSSSLHLSTMGDTAASGASQEKARTHHHKSAGEAAQTDVSVSV